MISFIVPVYKKTVDQFTRTINSLLDQTKKDLEIIAVFDGDDQVLESHAESFAKKDMRFRHIVIDHGGACKARNEGFKESKGDIIYFWDADCYAAPMMVETALKYWEDDKDAAFMYSGYKWTDPRNPGFESEEFDSWTIGKYNYVSTMSPIKREYVIDWDESLSGLQDWDYFRRIVENGGRGVYMPCGQNAVSAPFETDMPGHNDISMVKSREETMKRIQTVREKHGDRQSDWLVYGQVMKPDAINIAKIIEGDYFNQPFWITNNYKACLLVGFNAMELEQAIAFAAYAGKESKKVIYWMGLDAEMMAQGPYTEVKKLSAGVNKHFQVNLCPDVNAKNALEEMGIKADVVPFPRAEGPVMDTLPEKFKVLAFSDEENGRLIDSVIKAMPDVDFDKWQKGKAYPFKDYSMILRLSKDGRLFSPERTMLLHGRHMISNVQEPFAGYIDPSDFTNFKNKAIDRIYEVMGNPQINKEAQDYYLDHLSPQKFKERLNSVLEAK